DACGFADDGDLARTFESAHGVEYRVEALHVDLRARRLELLHKDLFARWPPVPRVFFGRAGVAYCIARRGAAEHFGAEGRVDGAPFTHERGHYVGEFLARAHGFEACGFGR